MSYHSQSVVQRQVIVAMALECKKSLPSKKQQGVCSSRIVISELHCIKEMHHAWYLFSLRYVVLRRVPSAYSSVPICLVTNPI